jgi:2-amino-4-hydroxy-6-hydroxymethyldihydropteridine diphosphokinase
MPRAGIALGSNLGDRLANLRAACTCLREIATVGETVLTAPVYQTEPLLCPPGSPEFLNTVIEIDFTGTAMELLATTRTIEQKLGRTPAAERNAPRVIDIDLLYFGDETIGNDSLTLPHPRIGERRFVLQPLVDIRPDLILPGQTLNIADLLQNLRSDEPPLVNLTDIQAGTDLRAVQRMR